MPPIARSFSAHMSTSLSQLLFKLPQPCFPIIRSTAMFSLATFVLKSNSNSNSNWTFIALNLPKQEDSKAQQNKKQSTKFCVQGHNRGRTPRRTPGG